jgi:carbonic anhydrase
MRMDHIIDGVLRFQRDVYPNKAALYRELSLAQAPTALFIGCSDSRVVPELLTQQGPGELFVVRNAGNIVPPYSDKPGGVTASIEYAVAVLGIPDIVVCGHSGCGAMTAIQSGSASLEKLPSVARWLHYADAARDAVAKTHAAASPADYLDALVHENVLAQLDNLLTHPVVANAIEAKQLRVHGWVYDMRGGSVETYDAQAQAFVPIANASFVSATPAE